MTEENKQNETLSNEKQNSVTLKKGVKGYNWDIKIYFDDVNPIDKLKEIDNSLKSTFE